MVEKVNIGAVEAGQIMARDGIDSIFKGEDGGVYVPAQGFSSSNVRRWEELVMVGNEAVDWERINWGIRSFESFWDMGSVKVVSVYRGSVVSVSGVEFIWGRWAMGQKVILEQRSLSLYRGDPYTGVSKEFDFISQSGKPIKFKNFDGWKAVVLGRVLKERTHEASLEPWRALEYIDRKLARLGEYANSYPAVYAGVVMAQDWWLSRRQARALEIVPAGP